MSIRISGDGPSGTLLRLVVTAVVLLAMLACGEVAQDPEPTSAPPPGMFSMFAYQRVPYPWRPAARRRAEHTGADAHATTDSYTQSYLYASANADATAYGHPYSQPNRHTRTDGDTQPDSHACTDGGTQLDSHACTDGGTQPDSHACTDGGTQPDSHPRTDGRTRVRTYASADT